MFNLEQEEDLTHFGQSLANLDDMDDETFNKLRDSDGKSKSLCAKCISLR
jgi:hypothetical protein